MTNGRVYPDIAVGDLVTASLLQSMQPLYARKAATEAAPTSSTTQQDDDELFVSVEANASYFVECWIRYSAVSATPDLRLNYSYPSGASFTRSDWGVPTSTTTTADSIDTTIQTTGDSHRGADATPRTIQTRGDLTVGSTAGTFRVRFSQSTSSADAVSVLVASHIRLTRYA
jgi:hypothetical protein